MLDGEKILITGATGKIAFPIARALAERNEVWGAARLRDSEDKVKLVAAGVRPVQVDMSSADFSMLPDDFTYVFHAAVDLGDHDWQQLRRRRTRTTRANCSITAAPLRDSCSARLARSTVTRVGGR